MAKYKLQITAIVELDEIDDTTQINIEVPGVESPENPTGGSQPPSEEQTPPNGPSTPTGEEVPSELVKKPSTSFKHIVGVTGGPSWDHFTDKNNHPAKNIKNVRMFNLVTKSYGEFGNATFPKDGPPTQIPGSCGTTDWATAWAYPIPNFTANKSRYCQLKSMGFNISISPERVIDEQGNPLSWPFKEFTPQQWGDNPRQAAYEYAKNMIHSFDGVINSFEMGNEPWGFEPEFYHEIQRGYVDAFKELNPNIKLGAAAFYNGFQTNYWKDGQSTPSNDQIGVMIPEDIRADLDYITVHPYAFSDDLSTINKSARDNWKKVEDIMRWRDQYAPNAEVQITEIGWPSTNPKASDYLMESLCLASYWGIDKVYIYQLLDRGDEAMFTNTSLLNADLTEKDTFTTINSLLSDDAISNRKVVEIQGNSYICDDGFTYTFD